MSAPLDGRTAFVTGGSRGIGKAIVRKLAKAGARVAFTYRGERDQALALQKELDNTAIALQMEVTDRASVAHAMDEAAKRFGEFSILVNNAGINKPTDFDQVTDADWDQILGVNLKGPFICSQVALPHLKAAGGGSIIHIGSVSGQYGGPRTAHYAASKAGLISLSQVIARFGAKSNIRSNVVAAGLIQSEMAAAGMASPAVAKAAETIVLGRLGTSDEVADAVVYLASPSSSYITAQTINVNGGLYF
ncbi:MAG: 3-oxoacyl-ACP reductase family protein [Alphaproteobacteria bacterium]|jgi:3-oxoacyl-[acyl-carrier protein] reductase|nr:3-oxoacyl-ACP reductase family protein [Alphaproteobacteria bacterium]